ncbi:hypothetical protein BGX38DRAFT_1334370 [Terfezia claveryi]|nr:hypothetical protein BGX38DRAFT_1334370 [Terfezia claveryi]
MFEQQRKIPGQYTYLAHTSVLRNITSPEVSVIYYRSCFDQLIANHVDIIIIIIIIIITTIVIIFSHLRQTSPNIDHHPCKSAFRGIPRCAFTKMQVRS